EHPELRPPRPDHAALLSNLGHVWDAIRAATGTDCGERLPALTDAQRLAFAVLDGDDQAALLLADEVQMAAMEGPAFVPRGELLGRIAGLEATVREVSEESHRRDDPHEGLLPSTCRDCGGTRRGAAGGLCYRCAGLPDVADDEPDDEPPSRRAVLVRFLGPPHAPAVVEVADGEGDIRVLRKLGIDARGRLTSGCRPVCIALEASPAPLPPDAPPA